MTLFYAGKKESNFVFLIQCKLVGEVHDASQCLQDFVLISCTQESCFFPFCENRTGTTSAFQQCFLKYLDLTVHSHGSQLKSSLFSTFVLSCVETTKFWATAKTAFTSTRTKSNVFSVLGCTASNYLGCLEINSDENMK